jgi:hypothetical protein
MKTWALMYSLIWVAVLQILVILFPVLSFSSTVDLHTVIGIVVVVLANYVYFLVRRTACPGRIKRIARVTAIMSFIQIVFGAVLYESIALAFSSSTLFEITLFFHVLIAVAIVAQASSAATAFDMWERKEFTPAQQLAGVS